MDGRDSKPPPQYSDEFAKAGVEVPVRVKKRKPLERLAPAADPDHVPPPDTVEQLELTAEPVAPIEFDRRERPNAVLNNGGPQKLRGLFVPWPPSSNRYWRSMPMVKKGTKFPLRLNSFADLYRLIRAITFPSTEAKDYLKRMEEWVLGRKMAFHTTKPLRIELTICPPNRRELDAHNYAKVLLDVLQKVGVYEDDSQIEKTIINLGPIIEGGKVIVSLWEITSDRNQAFNEALRT